MLIAQGSIALMEKKLIYQNREQNHVLDSPVIENNLGEQSYVIHFRIF